MARLNSSWRFHKPQQHSFFLVLVIGVFFLFTTRAFVSSVSTDLHLSDVETNFFNNSPKTFGNFLKVYNSLFANFFKRLAIAPAKGTELNIRKRRSGADSETFPFEAPETCSLEETELDQIIGLLQKFNGAGKDLCKVSTPKKVVVKTPVPVKKTVVSPAKSIVSQTKPIVRPIEAAVNSTKVPASTLAAVEASRLKSSNSTKSVSNPIKSASNWSKVASSVLSKSTGNSTKLVASPTKSVVKSTAVVKPTKSVTNATKPIINPTKSVVNSTKLASNPTKSVVKSTAAVNATKSVNSTKPIVSSTKSAVNSTKLAISPTKLVVNATRPMINLKNSANHSTKLDVSPINTVNNSTEPFSVRRKRSLSSKSGGCSQLIESIKTSTNNLKNTFCELSTSQESDPLYEEKKAAYEAEIIQLKEKLDNKDIQIEQKYKTKIDKLNADFQKLEKQMGDIVEELEDQHYWHIKTNAKLVLLHLEKGDIEKALDEFKRVEQRNTTLKIVKKALKQKYGVSTENIIKFVGRLSQVDTMVYGTLYLFHELERRQSLYEPAIVSLLQNTTEKIINYLKEMEKEEQEDEELEEDIDWDAVDQMILVHNKLDFLNAYTFKYD